MEYRTCVSDTEVALEAISQISDIPYSKGHFSNFDDSFADSGKDEDFYLLKGTQLEVSVQLERYEGYYFITITGTGREFENAKSYLSTSSQSAY